MCCSLSLSLSLFFFFFLSLRVCVLSSDFDNVFFFFFNLMFFIILSSMVDKFGHTFQSVTRGNSNVFDWLLPYPISTFVVPYTLSSLGLQLLFCVSRCTPIFH